MFQLLVFGKERVLMIFLVRAKVPPPQKPKEEYTSCAGKHCQICNVIKTTDNFQVITKDKKYFIRKVNLNCNTSHVIYLIECKTCGKPCIGSTETPFRARFNNYRSAQRNFEKEKKIKQESFHVHFSEEGHYGEKDWVITLTDSAENVEELRKKESFWQHELNTFQPLGLNEREVPLLF